MPSITLRTFFILRRITMKRKPAKTVISCGRRYLTFDGNWIIYSRWLFEKEVRPLRPGEIVHHKDENKLNDCIENYEAMPRGEHTSHHVKGKKKSLKTRIKISKSKTGMKRSKESIKKGILSITGTKRSKKACLNISKSLSGRKLSKQHKLNIGFSVSGEKNPNAILTLEKVNKIRYLYFNNSKYKQNDIGEMFNISKSLVNAILQGYSWNPNKLTKEELIEKSKVLRNPKEKGD
jgi:hypothetical protein